MLWLGRAQYFLFTASSQCSVDMNPFTDNPGTESVLKGQLVQAQHLLPKWSFCQQLGPHFPVAAQSVYGQCPVTENSPLYLN